ncbi:MFS transporter [Microvirga pudoricolor]|uniref:MFS transporter n=1 Tax=Microvirga pudoricolor TaxID=2778729 RepID=UPI00194ECA0C|nr:MFS transporter [Microvirga pudoricolor]MBM6592425.1 MFS transporter [Microvirga pudoricolor]
MRSIPDGVPRRGVLVSALGIVQILAFGTTLYLPAVLAKPITVDTGWPLAWVIGGLSIALVTAGLVSPSIGETIDRRGGRMVLASSSVLLAIGLVVIGLAPNLPVYLAAWVIVGFGMGGGLYDATFSTLGRIYGQNARGAITMVTLWGGFASTVCWPLSAFLVEHLGWRGTCGVYAALHLGLALPLHLRLLPGSARKPPEQPETVTGAPAPSIDLREHVPTILLIAAIVTISGSIASVLSVHLLTLLQFQGGGLAAAVALGTLFGPAQVLARFGEMTFGRRYHPVWTMLASVGLMALGIGLLLPGAAVAAIALILYGAGNGIGSIAKGTVPLALFGASHYPVLMGRIARPSLIAQAIAPALGAGLIGLGGTGALLPVLAGFAILNVGLVLALKARVGRSAS